MSLENEINRPDSRVFRRAYIKRRLKATGAYEADWQPITAYVKKWGTFDSAIDDVRLNNFNLSGANIVCVNDTGAFNPEDKSSSLWSGYLTRYNTLVKIEAGYRTGPENGGWGMAWGAPWGSSYEEYPTDPTQGIFILNNELPIDSHSNEVTLKCSSLKSIFDGVKSVEIPGLNATLTASEIVERIRDHTDGAGNTIFRQFISASSWTIQTTSNYYILSTDTSLQDASTVWDLITTLAECEGYVAYINRYGGFVFADRAANTLTSVFSFKGQGFPRPNIIKINEYKEDLDKTYNFFKFKYLEASTNTSYVTAGTATSVDPENIAWKYGARVYEFENRFVPNTATAQNIVDGLYTEYSNVKKEIEFTSKFHPDIDILDCIDVSYHSYAMAGSPRWDAVMWDDFNWAYEGENFDFDEVKYKIISKKLDLDNFTHTIRAREL